MGSDALSQAGAWKIYDRWLEDTRIVFADEPAGIETILREHSREKYSSPKEWVDSYLIAFAESAGLTLVSIDQGFRGKTRNLILLS
jgi:uncharacterized protein